MPSTTSVNYPKSEIEGHHQRAFEENNGTTKKGIFELGRPDRKTFMSPERRMPRTTPIKDSKPETEGHYLRALEEKEVTTAPIKCGQSDSNHYVQGVVELCFRCR